MAHENFFYVLSVWEFFVAHEQARKIEASVTLNEENNTKIKFYCDGVVDKDAS